MDKKEQIEYWLDTAEHDLKTAQTLYETGHYDWCLFIGHLVLEKALKAHWVNDNEEMPPKVNDLIKLADNIKLSFSNEDKLFYDTVNDFYFHVGYPDPSLNLKGKYTKDLADNYLPKIKENYNWFKSKMKY